MSLERLSSQNLTQKVADTDTYKLAISADAFVSIAKRLLSESHYNSFLASPYFASMLEGRLPGILANRQHCIMKEEDLAALRAYLKTSPSAAEFILFGDTTRFDNLADQVRQQGMNEELKAMAREIAAQTVLQEAIRFWVNDVMDGKILHELDSRQIAGLVVRMKISAAFADNLAFQASVVTPMMLIQASGRIEAGQGVRAAALNNKGLALLRLGCITEATSCFEEALRLNSNLEEAQKNLQQARDSIQADNGKEKGETQ